MARLIRLVKPLSGYMVLAILMGLVGHFCAAFITIFGGFAVLDLLGFATPVALKTTFVCVLLFALVRGIFRYAEQSCNHFIAFKLLALIRDKVFRALRRLCPAKLEGRDRGDLISVITSDIELLEVFYAHTISPAAIAALFTLIMCLFIGHYHVLLGLLALVFIGLYVWLFKGKTLFYALCISGCAGAALVLSMVLSSLVGTAVPMFFKKIHVDPAVASGPLITTVNDLVAVIAYYGLAYILFFQVLHLV